jgi:hypothetical protein
MHNIDICVTSLWSKLTPRTKNYLTKITSCAVMLNLLIKFLFSMKEDANPGPSVS